MGWASNRIKEEDTTVQISITLCCAYLSFFVAEYEIGVSGVLSCCSAGLTLAIFAQPLILNHENTHGIWSIIEWIGNTLIFILAGLIIGSRGLSHVKPVDLLYIIMAYIFVMIVRAAMMFLSYPLLSWLGRGCSATEAVFMVWGGLRGAVSMALALTLERLVSSGDTTVRDVDSNRVFLIVGGVAGLTLLLNATTAANVLKWLGLVDQSMSKESKLVSQYVKKRIQDMALKFVFEIRKSDPVHFNFQVIARYCSILQDIENVKEKLSAFDNISSNNAFLPSARRRSSLRSLTEMKVPDECKFFFSKLIIINRIKVVSVHPRKVNQILSQNSNENLKASVEDFDAVEEFVEEKIFRKPVEAHNAQKTASDKKVLRFRFIEMNILHVILFLRKTLRKIS
jgi:NhaP-type Na+/H+ and K+/H+ antiporter